MRFFIKGLLKRIFFLLFALPILLLAVIAVLLGTDWGFSHLLHGADGLLGSVFSIHRVEGNLLNRVHLEKVELHIHQVVDAELEEFIFNWQPKGLLAKELLIGKGLVQGLELHLAASAKEEKEEDKPIVLPDIQLPVALRVDDLQLEKVRIFTGKGPPVFVVDHARLKLAARGNEITIDRLLLNTPRYGGDIRGRVQLTPSLPLTLSGDWYFNRAGIGDLVGTLHADGDLEKLAVQLGLKAPAGVRLQGEVTDILTDLHWKASADTDHFTLQDLELDLPIDGTLTISEAAGTITEYGGTLAVDVQYEGYPRIQAQAAIEGDYSELDIEYLRIQEGKTNLETGGTINWSDGFSWDAELSGQELDPALFAVDWPGRLGFKLHSSGQTGGGSLQVDLKIDQMSGTLREYPLAISTRTSVQLDKGKAPLLTVDHLQIESGESMLQLAGSMSGEEIVLSLTGSDLKAPGYAVRHLQLDTDVTLREEYSGVNIRELNLALDKRSVLSSTGQVSWKEGISWQLALNGQKIDPSLFVEEWPADINMILHSSGQWGNGHKIVELRIEHLLGQLRGYPLSGSGFVAMDNDTIQVDNLHLQSGSSSLLVNGGRDQDLNLSFEVQSDDLATIMPDLGGSLHLQGTVQGTEKEPDIALQLSGSKLSFQEYSLGEIKGTVAVSLAGSGSINTDLTARDIQVQDNEIRRVQLTVKGSREQHTATLSVSATPGSGELTLAGGLDEELQWQGELSRLRVGNDRFGSWQTQGAALLKLAKTGASLKGFKFSNDQVKVGLQGAWQQEDGWQVSAGIDNFSLHLLQEWGIPTPNLDGIVTLTLSGQGQGAVPKQAELSISLPKLILTVEDEDLDEDGDEEEDTLSFQWDNSTVRAELKNGNGEISVHSLFQDGSTADINLTISDVSDFSDLEKMGLDGSLQIHLKDISPLTSLSNKAVTAAGEFGGSYALRGTAAHPEIDGSMGLLDGTIEIPAAGLLIKELSLSASGDGTENRVGLSLVSGEGELTASGQVKQNHEKEWVADVTIQGDKVQAVHLPEYRAVVSPDMQIKYGPNGLAISGAVTIDSAHIAPTGFAGAVSSSKDVVIVNGDGETEKNGLPLALDLTLIMGEEVEIDTFGLTGRLEGQLEVKEKPGEMITGLGSLGLVDATFNFKGVTLDIERGRVYYQGGPIEEPILDVQAQRKVKDSVAGIRVSGSVSEMDISLFSEPFMQQAEIMSMILTGKEPSSTSDEETSMVEAAATAIGTTAAGSLLDDIGTETGLDIGLDSNGSSASGVSLVVGKEIYEDLYISYGKGVTGESGTFKARYDLKWGFSVETEASSEATGADLRWSLLR